MSMDVVGGERWDEHGWRGKGGVGWRGGRGGVGVIYRQYVLKIMMLHYCLNFSCFRIT